MRTTSKEEKKRGGFSTSRIFFSSFLFSLSFPVEGYSRKKTSLSPLPILVRERERDGEKKRAELLPYLLPC